MSKKRVEREIRAAHRRHKKEKQRMGDDFDDFSGLNTQLGILGLTLKQIPGKVANEIFFTSIVKLYVIHMSSLPSLSTLTSPYVLFNSNGHESLYYYTLK